MPIGNLGFDLIVGLPSTILRQSVPLPTWLYKHPCSLLPRGSLHPSRLQSWLVTETGITIMKMDAGVDTGPIISQRRYRSSRGYRRYMFNKLAPIGPGLLIDTLPGYISGRIAPPAARLKDYHAPC
jgi:methionyl-tRNA formyltransferase